MAFTVPGEGGGAAWGDSLCSPTLGAPFSFPGQMGPHPLLSRDTETLCLRSQRLGGRHCWLLPLSGVGGDSSGPRIHPLGSSLWNLSQSPHVYACSIAQTSPPGPLGPLHTGGSQWDEGGSASPQEWQGSTHPCSSALLWGRASLCNVMGACGRIWDIHLET